MLLEVSWARYGWLAEWLQAFDTIAYFRELRERGYYWVEEIQALLIGWTVYHSQAEG